MAKRPLENLVLSGWGLTPASQKFVFRKGGSFSSRDVFRDPNGLSYDEAETRQLHAWLGQIIIDLDHGV